MKFLLENRALAKINKAKLIEWVGVSENEITLIKFFPDKKS